ncbi:MAG: DUF1800 domain-containing protein [Armatimonadetes bacterium]|nr:DUF1800 domain-containing protein [Armatimonadota bacterium]
MALSRRQVLGYGALAGSGLLAGCGRLATRYAETSWPAQSAAPDSQAKRWMNRTGFGPRPGDYELLVKEGFDVSREKLLAASEPESIAATLALRRLEPYSTSESELESEPYNFVAEQLRQGYLIHATSGSNQLLERMVDFWSNHFNIYFIKANLRYRKGTDEMQVIRQHALGNFVDMVTASAKSPAMLEYLDNAASVKGHPNENYARELLELHTLGVHGGYTQQDVMEAARCFTGWTIEKRFLHRRGEFMFDAERHDSGAKFVLGHHIPAGGGEEDGLAVIRLAALHPSTADHLAGKLCACFLGDSSHPMRTQVAKAFLDSKGDIKATLRPLLDPRLLAQSKPVAKRPLDYVVSAVRCLGGSTDGAALHQHLANMGQPLYEWPLPDGYPVSAEAWTGSMLARWNFVAAMMAGEIKGTQFDKSELHLRLGGDPGKSVRHVLGKEPQPGEPLVVELEKLGSDSVAHVGLCMASPEFQWR